MDTDGLLKIVLVLVIVWLAVSILEEVIEGLAAVIGLFDGLLGLAIVVLIVLFLLDRI